MAFVHGAARGLSAVNIHAPSLLPRGPVDAIAVGSILGKRTGLSKVEQGRVALLWALQGGGGSLAITLISAGVMPAWPTTYLQTRDSDASAGHRLRGCREHGGI